MKPRKQRMFFVGVIIAGVVLATVLVLLSLGENMMYFFSPSQVNKGEAPMGAVIRVGGLVVEGSVSRDENSLDITFDLSDTADVITVAFNGVLPDLFREGQGIVAIGKLGADGIVRADKVLAKHDENYMPPEVADALKTAAEGGSIPMPSTHSLQ